mmetsp:Transcript_20092/g.46821  ORF Transcript_20092/g.46821 Transcript_20092/m.46821 type:complete len:148 (+) Transcript_20092:864-1307(+)
MECLAALVAGAGAAACMEDAVPDICTDFADCMSVRVTTVVVGDALDADGKLPVCGGVIKDNLLLSTAPRDPESCGGVDMVGAGAKIGEAGTLACCTVDNPGDAARCTAVRAGHGAVHCGWLAAAASGRELSGGITVLMLAPAGITSW